MLVAVVQLLWASSAARRDVHRGTFIAGLVFNGAVLAVWLVSRSVGLPALIPDTSGVEAIGWKDTAASGLAFAALLGGGLALAMPATAAAALIPSRSGERILRTMAVATLAVTIPGALASHQQGHEHDAGRGHGEVAALEVHDHSDDPDHEEVHAADGEEGHPHVDSVVLQGDGHDHSAGAAESIDRHAQPHGATASGDTRVHDAGTPASGAAAPAPGDAHHGTTAAPATASVASARGTDPLVGPGSVSTVRLGPFALLPSIPSMPAPHLSPTIPRIAPGQMNLLPLVGVPPPCQDCYMLALVPDLVYADGSPANLDTGPMLHHAVWTDTSRPDPVCAPQTLIGALGHRVFASGNERTSFTAPDGFGMPVGNGVWGGAVELMNISTDLRIVYVQLTARWLPRSSPDIRPVTSVWLDIDSCGDSEVDIPAGVSDVVWDWKSKLTGRIVTAGGHLHDGGEWLGLTNHTTGEHVCTSVAGYGADLRYRGSLDAMSVCAWDRLGTVRAGEVLRLVAHYNTAAPAAGVMGIMVILVHETDDLTSGSPSPYSAQRPRDGDPPRAGHQH